jgi:hypothetical protein
MKARAGRFKVDETIFRTICNAVLREMDFQVAFGLVDLGFD